MLLSRCRVAFPHFAIRRDHSRTAEGEIEVVDGLAYSLYKLKDFTVSQKLILQ